MFPEKLKKEFDLVDAAWGFFTSLKLSIYLFILIAAALVTGTFLPQGGDAAAQTGSRSPAVWSVFDAVGAFDLYHTWWFAALLLMLGLNLVACSLDRLPAVWQRFRLKRPLLDESVTGSARFTREFTAGGDSETARLVDVAGKALKKRVGGFVKNTAQDGSVTLWHDSGRCSRLSVMVIHASMVLILIGGIVTSLAGFEGMVFIPEGGEASAFSLRLQGGGTVESPIPFTIRCDRFVFEQFGDGRPKEYRSTIGIIENGKRVLTRDVSVNSPMHYGGLSFYQASYQRDVEKTEFVFEFDMGEGKPKVKGSGRLGDAIAAAGELDASYSVVGYEQDFSGFGPAVKVARKAEGEEATEFWLFKKYPGFDRKHREAAVSLSIKEEKPAWMTGLQVARDPGSPLVFIGSAFLLMGLFMVFYVGHRQVWIGVAGGKVTVAASASRNPRELDRKVGLLAGDLEKEIGCT